MYTVCTYHKYGDVGNLSLNPAIWEVPKSFLESDCWVYQKFGFDESWKSCQWNECQVTKNRLLRNWKCGRVNTSNWSWKGNRERESFQSAFEAHYHDFFCGIFLHLFLDNVPRCFGYLPNIDSWWLGSTKGLNRVRAFKHVEGGRDEDTRFSHVRAKCVTFSQFGVEVKLPRFACSRSVLTF